MMNLEDFQLALQFHVQANQSISMNEFQRAVRISSGFELHPKIVEVIFKVFDDDGDGHLSYKEFIAVLKDRLKRGLKVSGFELFFPNFKLRHKVK
jgi:Ca2+-binding EF-hand superfamily protein